jgi:hypothetical protein
MSIGVGFISISLKPEGDPGDNVPPDYDLIIRPTDYRKGQGFNANDSAPGLAACGTRGGSLRIRDAQENRGRHPVHWVWIASPIPGRGFRPLFPLPRLRHWALGEQPGSLKLPMRVSQPARLVAWLAAV